MPRICIGKDKPETVMIKKVFLIVLMVGAFTRCAQKKSMDQQEALISDLRIENGVNRGTRFIDAAGTDRILTYIPVTITNNGDRSMDLDISFLNEYENPQFQNKEKYQIVILSKKWTIDDIEVTRSMVDDLNDPKLNRSRRIKPNEKFVFGIGTIREIPATCSAIPNTLFIRSKNGLYNSCDDLFKSLITTKSSVLLGIKLNYCEGGCILLPCGTISFSKQ